MALQPDIKAQAARYRCAAHPDKRLTVALFGPQPTLFCAGCKRPPASLVGNDSLTHTYKTGGALPAAVVNHMEQKFGARDMTEQTEGIVLRDPTPQEITQAGERFASQLPSFKPEAWRALSAADKNLAAKLCLAGFQPFHFTVTSYKTRDGGITASLYLNLQGREFNARMAMRDRFGGIEVRPMNAQERQDWGLADGEVGAVATLYERDPRTGHRWAAMTDIGRAGGKKDAGEERTNQRGEKYTAGGNPIARDHPQEQALARARARVLINGAPLGVPIGTFARETGEVVEMSDEIGQLPAIEAPAREEDSTPRPQGATPSPFEEEGDEEPAEEIPAWRDADPAPDVDTSTGEVTSPARTQRPGLLPTDPLVAEVVAMLGEAGLSRKDAQSLAYDSFNSRGGPVRLTADAAVLAMLRDGYEPHEVVTAVKAAKGGVQQQLA